MEWKRSMTGIMAAVGLLVMIFDSELALKGARSGIDICIKTVIPSLLPFFILSMTLTTALGGHVSAPLKKTARILGIPQEAASILIPAVLGGYPVGAKCAGDLYHQNVLVKKDAERILAFCNNAGPSFLFGMVSSFFPSPSWTWRLWLIHLCSAVFTALSIPAAKSAVQRRETHRNTEAEPIIISAAKAMCQVCCWVILFRTLITFLKVWFLWRLSAWMQVLAIGILELANGCCELQAVTDSDLRFVLCSCMLAFGGICVFFQTASVTKGLTLGYYIKGKLLQTAYSFILSSAAVAGYGFYALLALIVPTLFRKMLKRDGNPGTFPV